MKLLASVLLFAAGSAWAADAKLLGLLMPDARMIAGVQVDQVKGSAFGQFVLSQVPAAEIEKLKTETGFDPRTDLTEMVAGAVKESDGLIVGKGTFQPAKIQNLAMTHGAKLENYRGVAIIENTAAFLDGTTVVIGKAETIKPAIDRWLSSAQLSGPLASKALALGATSHAWGVATGLSELQPAPQGQVPPEAQMVQNVLSKITTLSGSLMFGDGVAFNGQAVATSAEDAQSLADVFQFLVTMAGSKQPLPLVPQVSTSGTTVTVTANISQQLLEQIMKPAGTARAAVRVERPATAAR